MAKTSRTKVKISGWTRFDSFNLSIAPSLAGAEHQFSFLGHQVTIRLPKRPPAKKWGDQKARITCSGWRVTGGRRLPLNFHVHQIDVLVLTKRSARVVAKALERVDPANFNKSESEKLDRIASAASVILEAAFDFWISILRWKSGFPTICQFTYARQRSGWGTYLLESGSEKSFYAPRRTFSLQREQVVDTRIWRAVARAVAAGDTIPIWRQHYAEAHQKLRIGDIRGFVLELAISVETIVRQLLTQLLRDGATPGLKRLLGSLALSRMIDDWTKIGFDSKRWKQAKECRDDVKRIIELRNIIMHRGEAPRLEHGDAHTLGQGVEEFLELGEREFSRDARAKKSA